MEHTSREEEHTVGRIGRVFFFVLRLSFTRWKTHLVDEVKEE